MPILYNIYITIYNYVLLPMDPMPATHRCNISLAVRSTYRILLIYEHLPSYQSTIYNVSQIKSGVPPVPSPSFFADDLSHFSPRSRGTFAAKPFYPRSPREAVDESDSQLGARRKWISPFGLLGILSEKRVTCLSMLLWLSDLIMFDQHETKTII